MAEAQLFEGPYREELADGTLVYRGYAGEIEYSGPRLHADLPLDAREEHCRWWRMYPLSSNIAVITQSGYSIAEAAAASGVPVAVAQRIAEKTVTTITVITRLD